jgi:protein-S-isoprenylcysteine O-methyltransferase Ste14
VAGGLLGWILETQVVRIRLVGGDASATILQIAGALLIAAGLAVTYWGIFTFRRARTAVYPHYPASRLVQGGPYRFSRNPMYTGLALVYVGLSMLTNTVWPLLLLPLVLVALVFLVIHREERYLASAFGEEYEAYRRRVRRWL